MAVDRSLSIVATIVVVTLLMSSSAALAQSGAGLADGDAGDRVIAVETRLGTDLQTGTLWPVRNAPTNLSVAYTYFYADANDVPYSERYQNW